LTIVTATVGHEVISDSLSTTNRIQDNDENVMIAIGLIFTVGFEGLAQISSDT
jgi:hypothetical protein